MNPLKSRKYVFDQTSISKIRNQLHLTQDKLAQELGVTKTAISRWEQGKVKPDLDSLAAIYSLAVENKIQPVFFKLKEGEVKHGRSRLIVSWDFQNSGWAMLDVVKQGESFKKTLKTKFPTVTSTLFKVLASPYQKMSLVQLEKQGWRTQVFDRDIDAELESQAWGDCNQDPQDTIFALITADGDFTELLEDLRNKGVRVYLLAPNNTNQRLIEAVGKKNYLPVEFWGLSTLGLKH